MAIDNFNQTPDSLAVSMDRIAKLLHEKKIAETQQEAAQDQKKEIMPVPFPACWGDEYRAAPNAFFRSALFPALRSNEKENRQFMKKQKITCVAGIEIIFTGQQFDQSDLDIYLEILNFAKSQNMGTVVKFTAYSMLQRFQHQRVT